MVLERLGRALHGAIQKLARAPAIDEKTIKELTREIQRALLQADVNVELVLKLTKRIEKRALEEKPLPGLDKRAHVVKIVYEELSEFLGKPSELEITPGKTKTILMVGLQGSGKTTSVAKLAAYIKKRGYKVGMVCADTFRAGAYEQLSQLGEQAGIEVFGAPVEKDSIKIAEKGLKHFRERNSELILVDTAGRHKKEDALMEEMRQLVRAIKPDEVMLVVDGTIGQQAKDQAAAFKQATDIGSILVTKLDGTAKGGGALSAVAATGAPIKFIGSGEHLEDLEPYVPSRFLARLLGMGDLETLLRRVEELVAEEKIRVPEKKELLAGKLTLRDVYEQLEAVSKMGPLKKVLQMIPGIGVSIPDEQMRVGEEKLKRFKVIMQSMTEGELENPKIINASRIRRIARGSGTSEKDVKELLKQYELIQKFMKSFLKGKLPKMGPWAKLAKGKFPSFPPR
jgi:signal recognition particle subunit SRP54